MENQRRRISPRGGREISQRHPPLEAPRDSDSTEDETPGNQRRRSMEQLVFDEDSGQLLVKKERPRQIASTTVLTGIATSGFF